jgi:16S rRNA (cytosine1402-N4)-methyltransferase
MGRVSGGFDHASVLVDEVLGCLDPRPGRVYTDCTVGGGGHAWAILDRSAPDGRLYGIDRDPAALAATKARLAGFMERVTLIHGAFGDVRGLLAEAGVDQVHGFVLDLGVSSPQLDVPERGFSFTREGPLDMRMDPTRGATALELIRELSEPDLAEVLRDFGEERYHKRIARLIKQAVAAGTLGTTLDLAGLVTTAIPVAEQRQSRIHPATRTFQALRIAVNRELDQLKRFLAEFPGLLAPGGRCVIISFHSLEDRLVKHAFRDLAWASSLPAKYAAEAGERLEAVCVPVTKKAVVASPAEVAHNPRSRSAKLRACERTAAPYLPMQRGPS